MNKTRGLGIFTAAMFGLFGATSASAALFDATTKDCDIPGAIISQDIGPTATACSDDTDNNGAQAEFDSVMAWLGEEGYDTDGWNSIGKYDNDGGAEGQNFEDFQLTVGPGNDDYGFSFSVTSATYAGYLIDFVLFVKQGVADDFAYYWEQVELDIDGFYNSFNQNQGDDYSHVSGFVRIGEKTEVPEPATLALLGLGLVGFGVARRRMATR